MKRVTGLGGVFFKAKNASGAAAWYKKHLGLDSGNEGGVIFKWREYASPRKAAYTVWSIFPSTTRYFRPSTSPFMINFRVANLSRLLRQLKKEGVTISGDIEEYPYGKFAWIVDPDGNKIELWEPNDRKP